MNVEITDTTQNIIDQIVKNENIKTPSEISVSQGSQSGDGYTSETYTISIKNDVGKYIKLFVKYLPVGLKCNWKDAYVEAFNAEYNFYTEVYPVFNQFQNSKNIKEPFNNVPKHFNIKMKKGQVPPIIMENLSTLGYRLRDRKQPVDDAHLKLSINAIARYHAINYAIKDQQPDEYNKLTNGICDFFGKYHTHFGFADMMKKCIAQLMDSYNPVLDIKRLEYLRNLSGRIVDYLTKVFCDYDEYFIIAQGDCWSNNMMFHYNDETTLPNDVKLIDWQAQRISSPLLDFSYFFYTLARKKELDNAEDYLNLYYNTLSQRITELGSDPEKLYPYTIFRDHWKKYSLFGLYMGFLVIKAQLFEDHEVPNLLKRETDGEDDFAVVIQNQDVYIKRLRDLIEYFINQNLLT